MPFDFDTTSPADSSDISLFPNNERNVRIAIDAWTDVEHTTVEGRHRFGVGTESARDAIPDADWVTGSVWYATDVVPGHYVAQVLDGAAPANWQNVGLVFADENNVWTAGQFGVIDNKGTASGVIVCDLATASAFAVEATGNITISVTNPPDVDETAAFTIEVLQGGGGPHTITWTPGTFVFPFGLAPALTAVAAARDVFSCLVLQDGTILVSVLPDIS